MRLVLTCDGKVNVYIYMSKELWRGPESLYTLQQGLCVAHDTAHYTPTNDASIIVRLTIPLGQIKETNITLSKIIASDRNNISVY